MAKDFVSQQVVDQYDHHIRKLIPGYELVHQHVQVILNTQFQHEAKRVLIVGCGTGYELGYLLRQFPSWHFVVSDLSQTMLDKAKAYVQPWNLQNRVEFILGDFSDFYIDQNFDIVLSILVSHFVAYKDKALFFQKISNVLRPQGIFMTFDLMKFNHEIEAQQLQQLCQCNGLSENQTEVMLSRLKEDFYPLSEQETFDTLLQAKFKTVQRFIQVASYCGYIVTKE